MTAGPFSVDTPLPTAPLVIEASAGTGKTFTLAALATRFVAERDVRAAELLVVTFTRAATMELRGRLRERFVDAARHLAVEPPVPVDDPLLNHLADRSAADRAVARRRLERAVTEFDAATITTIHGFAGQVLGLLGESDDEAAPVDDTDELTLTVCADVLAARSAQRLPGDVLPSHATLVELTQLTLGRPGLRLRPEIDDDAPDEHHLRRELVVESVRRIEDERGRLGQRSYGDLLTDLRDQLAGSRGAAAVDLLRGRFRVALIDEFQDTDPVQWEIFQAVFAPTDPGSAAAGETPGTLVLVGDPKQAIYSFRGADIHTYVDAIGAQDDVRTLAVNWRSDDAVLRGVDRLFTGLTFGAPTIAFSPVAAAPRHELTRLRDGRGVPRPGLALRVGLTEDLGANQTLHRKERVVPAPVGKDVALIDLADVVRDLLDDGWIPTDPADADPAGPPNGPSRRLVPGDIAVLVRSATDGEAVQQELIGQGVPAVLARGASVLESPAAEQWRWLLEALQRPTDPGRARTFAIGWFAGHDAAWLDRCDEADLAGLQERLWTWATVLQTSGLDAFLRRVLTESGVVERVLARADGDRALTDLEHVAELFRTETTDGRVSLPGLRAVLDHDPDANPNAEFEGDASSRRVESEADAVQIMTVWVAKGLEFPVVCCPTLWAQPRKDPLIYLDEDRRRSLDLSGGEPWPDKDEAAGRKAAADVERAGEDLRLLYVALTRAKHQTVVWWASSKGSDESPLGRVLFARHPDGTLDQEALASRSVPAGDDTTAIDRLTGWLRPDDLLTIRRMGKPTRPATRWVPPAGVPTPAPLGLAALTSIPDRATHRWSFTRISSRAADTHDNIDPTGPPGPDTPPGADEPVADPDGVDATVAAVGPARYDDPDVSPLAPLPASAAFGLLVHSLYEHVDFTDADLPAAVGEQLGRELSWRTISLTPPALPDATEADGRARVVDGVVASLRTPLGPAFDDRRLCDLSRADRLDELDFELHLAGGRVPTDAELGRLVLAHLPADDPFRPWAERVAAGLFDVRLAGHLTGSIDVVLRVRAPEGTDQADRYVIVDYKTNRLHDPKGPPDLDDYHPDRLVAEMAHHHYTLQALLYSVALHRYLRWRLPDYDPARHLGGAAYLFVRGMSGQGTRRRGDDPHGVCRWAIPPALVVALSDLLAGETAPAPAAVDPSPADVAPARQGSLFETDEVVP